jgi:hypothetical protein
MSNKYPKNPNFNNIIVRNNGNGRVTSDIIYTDTIYVKNLVVTDNLKLPILNIDSLQDIEVDKLIINKEFKKVPKNSGNIIYNNEIEDIMIKKNGKMHEISTNNKLGNISNVLFEKSNNIGQTISNSFNKFESIKQTINFNGNQSPNSKGFILGSNNNINFLLDDSSFYLFEGYIIANIKNKVFSSFGHKKFKNDAADDIKLKRMKINYSTFLIKNGLIKMQENDINSYETIKLSNKIYNTSFRLKKLSVGNKCYLAIETENQTDNYINWKAKIDILKINVKSTFKKNGNDYIFFTLKNKPEKSIFKWDCYSLESNTIFYRYNERINFYNIPLYSLSKKNGTDILNTIFFKGDNDNNSIIDIDSNNNEIINLNDTNVLKKDDSVIIFNKDFDTFYTVFSDDMSLLVRDIQNNENSINPFAYKNSYYHQSPYNKQQKTNYIKSKGFWSNETFENNDVKIKQSTFFSVLDIDYSKNKLINYIYLIKSIVLGKNDYFDYYMFSLNRNFIVNFVSDKIPEFKKATFLLDNDKSKHYFIYKDIGALMDEYRQIFLSNRSVYNFQFGTINIIEGTCIIIDSDPTSNLFKKSKTIKIYADFYIPTFQDVRSDIINKLLVNKLSTDEINNYLENAYINKNFMNVQYININDKTLFIPKIDNNNSIINTLEHKELFNDFDIKISLALRNINLKNINKLNYATISKELLNFNNFYLKVNVKSSLSKSYQINILFKNNIFDIFSI